MTRGAAPESIEERVLAGGNRELERLAAGGLVPLPPEDLIPLQVRLTESEDSEVATIAARSLAELDPRLVLPLLDGDPDARTLHYFSMQAEHPLILESILRRKDLPSPIFLDLASRVSGELQDVLILRQDAILEHPPILDALEANPRLEDRVRRRIREYREHLLRPEPEPEPASDAKSVDDEDLASPEETAAAIEAAKRVEIENEIEGEIDDETGLSEGQIRTLTVPVRLRLARGSGRALRDILIRDTNPQVACAVLKFNSFSDGDIERVARMRNLVEDVLEAIGRESRWVRRYPVAVALVKNPRTPIPVAVGLVPRLAVRDLSLLRRDRNISEAVRSRAQRLFALKIS